MQEGGHSREGFSQERHLSLEQRLGGGKVYQAKMTRTRPRGKNRVTYWNSGQGSDAVAQV